MTAAQPAAVTAAPKPPCPTDVTAALVFHICVRADAASGAPTTDHGRALLASARPFNRTAKLIGECLCHSSLVFVRPPCWQPSPVATDGLINPTR